MLPPDGMPTDLATGVTPGPTGPTPGPNVARALEGAIDLPGPAGQVRPEGPSDKVEKVGKLIGDQVGMAHETIDNEINAMIAQANEMHSMLDEEGMKVLAMAQKAALAQAQRGSKTFGGEEAVGFGVS